MTNILVFGDMHIATKAEFSVPTEDGLTTYLQKVEDTFYWISNTVRQISPDAVVFLGDLFESTGYVDTVCLELAVKHISILKQRARVYWLVGNHDWYSIEHNQHNLCFLSDDVMHTPSVRQINDLLVGFIPYATDFNFSDAPPADVYFTHIDVIGGVYNKSVISKDGVDPTTVKPPVFNGHFHMPSEVRRNFINVGSPLSRDFRDVDSPPRGIVSIEFNGKNLTSYTRLPNPHDIPFVDVDLDGENAQKVLNNPAWHSNHYVRVKYPEEYADIAESMVTAGCRLEPSIQQVEIKPSDMDETALPEDNFIKYVDRVMLFDEPGDREKIVELGLSLIKKFHKETSKHRFPLELIHATISNFHSIGNIEVKLSDQGLVFVEGPNGSGKTSISEAIYWCLTSLSLRGYRGDDVIMRGRDECSVEVSFKMQGKTYVVVRSRPNKLTLCCDGESLTCRKVGDTDSKLREVIGRSEEILKHSVFLTSDLSTRFTGLSPAERVKLIEHITDLPVYSSVYKAAAKKYDQLQSEWSELVGRKKAVGENITKLNNNEDDATTELVEARQDRTEKLQQTKQQLRELNSHLSKIRVRQQEYHDTWLEAKNKADDLSSLLAAKTRERIAVDTKVARLKQKKDAINAEHTKLCGITDKGQCDVCLSEDIDNKHITSRKQALAVSCGKIQSLMNASEVQREEVNNSMIVIQHQYDENKESLNEALNLSNKFSTDVTKAEGRVYHLKQQVVHIRTLYNNLEAKRTWIRDEIKRLEQELQQLDTNINNLHTNVGYAEFLRDAFSPTGGIRMMIWSNTTLPFLNGQLSAHSDRLGMPCYLQDHKTLRSGDTRSELHVVPKNGTGYKGLSRGEKRKIDLAMQASIRDLAIFTGGSRINLTVCDEIIDPLDDDSVVKFIELLRTTSKGGTVLLMSHKPHIEANFDKKWTAVKSSGITSLEITNV